MADITKREVEEILRSYNITFTSKKIIIKKFKELLYKDTSVDIGKKLLLFSLTIYLSRRYPNQSLAFIEKLTNLVIEELTNVFKSKPYSPISFIYTVFMQLGYSKCSQLLTSIVETDINITDCILRI